MSTEQNYVSEGKIATQPQEDSTAIANQDQPVEQSNQPAPRPTRRPFRNYVDMQFELQPVTEHFEISDAGVVLGALQAYRNNHWQELKENLQEFAQCGLSEKEADQFAQSISEGHIRLLLTIIDRCNDNIDALTDQMDVSRYYHYHRNA